MYTCRIRINAKLVKEGSFRKNAKLVKWELKQTTSIHVSRIETIAWQTVSDSDDRVFKRLLNEFAKIFSDCGL